MDRAVRLPVLPGLRISRCLGRGGMGAVFLVRDDAGHRPLALKVIASTGTPDSSACARFATEIAALTEIRHANVVRLIEAGVVDGVPYALLERIRGRSLARLDVPDPEVAVDVGRQLAAATAAVHAAGWLHRDLKPANAMVGLDGLVTLIDFGLARRQGQPVDPVTSRSGAAGPRITEVGMFVGTKGYLAPEVVGGHEATTATDVFALGVVLRDLVERAGCLPAGLGRLIAATTAADPGRRPAAAEVAAELARSPSRRARFVGRVRCARGLGGESWARLTWDGRADALSTRRFLAGRRGSRAADDGGCILSAT